jgi:hypothetical protein
MVEFNRLFVHNSSDFNFCFGRSYYVFLELFPLFVVLDQTVNENSNRFRTSNSLSNFTSLSFKPSLKFFNPIVHFKAGYREIIERFTREVKNTSATNCSPFKDSWRSQTSKRNRHKYVFCENVFRNKLRAKTCRLRKSLKNSVIRIIESKIDTQR